MIVKPLAEKEHRAGTGAPEEDHGSCGTARRAPEWIWARTKTAGPGEESSPPYGPIKEGDEVVVEEATGMERRRRGSRRRVRGRFLCPAGWRGTMVADGKVDSRLDQTE